MTLQSLTYVSSATREMTEEDIKDILNVSRRNNQALNITGMLLYRNGYFIQALEGEEENVMALYNRIEQDPRHKNTLVVSTEAIDERVFNDWSMGFKNLDNINPDELDGYTDFLQRPFGMDELSQKPSKVKTLLSAFRSKSR